MKNIIIKLFHNGHKDKRTFPLPHGNKVHVQQSLIYKWVGSSQPQKNFLNCYRLKPLPRSDATQVAGEEMDGGVITKKDLL